MTATTRALVESARDGDDRGARRRRVRAGLRVDAGILLALVIALILIAILSVVTVVQRLSYSYQKTRK